MAFLTLISKLRWKMYLAAFIVNLLYLSTGCMLAWPSPVLPMLKEFGYTDEQNSWIASIMALGAVVGSITIGFITSWLGRKATLCFNGCLFLLSWLALFFPKNMSLLCIGRFIAGYAMSMTFNIIPVYLMEIAQDDVRQALTSPVEFFIGIGFILQFLFGSFLDYYQIQMASLIVVLTFLLPFILMPESPFYLVSQGKDKKAEKVFTWLWNKHDNLDEEVVKIQNILSLNQTVEGTVNKMDLLKKKGYRRAFFTIFFIVCTQQFTAINVLESYFIILLEMASLPFPSSRATVALAAIYAITSCAAPPLVRYFGTKTVFISTTFIVAFCQGIIGVYMLLMRLGYEMTPYYLVLLFSFGFYFSAFAIGAGPLPWSIMAELSPAEHRSFITCVCSSGTWLLCLLLLRFFYSSIQMFGPDSVFFFYSIALAVTGVITIVILPDTKSMSLLQVKNQFLETKNNNNVESNVDSKNVSNT